MQTAERVTDALPADVQRLDGRPTCPTQGDARPDFADFVLLGTLAVLLMAATAGIVWAMA